MNKRIRAGAAALLGALALAGCSAGAEGPEEADVTPIQAKALLDSTTGSITLPLMAYSPSEGDMRVSTRAIAAASNECLRPFHLSAPIPPAQVTPREDRMYGIWVGRLASRYGYSSASSTEGSEDPDLSKLTPAQNEAWDECGAKAVATVPASRLPGISADSLSEKLRFEARSLARNSSEWREARREWKECMKGKGYSIGDGPEDWMPVHSPTDPAERVVRMAVDDVACKTTVNLVQRLGDIEASYQQALIVKNEAALKAQRDEIDRQVGEAKTWLAARGL